MIFGIRWELNPSHRICIPYRIPQTRTYKQSHSSYRLLLALGITDFMIGPTLVVYHLVIVNLGHESTDIYHCRLHTVEQILTAFLATASTLFTFFMSLDRYVSIKMTFWYAVINDRFVNHNL